MRAYAQLARSLADAGSPAVFGVMGDGNMHWIAAYRDLPGCAWYPAWHEAGAVWMADGWARVTGGVGVATVTMGPGLAQALPAVMTAVRTRRPVVVVTAALADLTPPLAQWTDQAALVAATGAEYVSVRRADELAAGIAAAFAAARAGRPAVLAVDLDLFENADAGPRSPAPDPGTAPVLPDDEVLDAAAAALGGARAPVLLLGGGVVETGCADAALALGRRIGAAFGTTVGGRAHLADEAWDLGVLGMMANPVARAVIDRADVVLVLGAALDRYNCDGTRLGADARMVRVDRRPPAELWSPAADTLDVTGDLAPVLAALIDRLPGGDATGLRTEAVRRDLECERDRQAGLAATPTAEGPNPWAVVAELDRALPGNAHVVVGIGHFWYFVAPHLSPDPDRRFHFTTGFASIGQALPVGVGAALAHGRRPVIVIEGDGSVVMNIQELQAAVRHGADLLVVVLNNRAYGSEYHKLALAGLDPRASVFDETPFDLVAVATAMGATARVAADPAELRAAVGELVATPGVRLIDARISASTMSETYLRQHGRPRAAVGPASGPSHRAGSTLSAASPQGSG